MDKKPAPAMNHRYFRTPSMMLNANFRLPTVMVVRTTGSEYRIVQPTHMMIMAQNQDLAFRVLTFPFHITLFL